MNTKMTVKQLLRAFLRLPPFHSYKEKQSNCIEFIVVLFWCKPQSCSFSVIFIPLEKSLSSWKIIFFVAKCQIQIISITIQLFRAKSKFVLIHFLVFSINYQGEELNYGRLLLSYYQQLRYFQWLHCWLFSYGEGKHSEWAKKIQNLYPKA